MIDLLIVVVGVGLYFGLLHLGDPRLTLTAAVAILAAAAYIAQRTESE